MRSSTLKWIVLSATLLAAIVVTVQLYWLKKVYSFEQRQFNINVGKSIRGLFEDLKMNDAPGISLQQLIHALEARAFFQKAFRLEGRGDFRNQAPSDPAEVGQRREDPHWRDPEGGDAE